MNEELLRSIINRILYTACSSVVVVVEEANDTVILVRCQSGTVLPAAYWLSLPILEHIVWLYWCILISILVLSSRRLPTSVKCEKYCTGSNYELREMPITSLSLIAATSQEEYRA